MLEEWNRREIELFNTDPERVPPLCILTGEQGALVGSLKGESA